ncbi:MAG: acetylxylan esterase [Phycisphaerae bacterium]|nr:acetylxylan esterase [Phycisphaerae bacterium]
MRLRKLVRPRAVGLVAGLILGWWVAGLEMRTTAAQGTDLETLLGERIVEPDVPLEEVARFCEIRVPVMPQVAALEEWESLARRWRQDVLAKVVLRGEAAKWAEGEVKVEWLETIPGGVGYHIRKLRFEAVPGLWIPALLYEPDKLEGRVPVGLAVNGHEGIGKSVGYKQTRCINQVKRGMIVLNVEWLGMGQLRGEGFDHYRANQLDLCGTPAVAPFFLSMKRSLDILLKHPNADPARVAVAGLSGGGWQTIFISALDPRVTLCNPVAGYSSFATRARFVEDLGDPEQTPCDLATVVDYKHLTAMCAPRPTLLTYNAKDNCCFRADHALQPLLDAATPIFALYEKGVRLRSHVNQDPGTHNFERENREEFYKLLGDHFFAVQAFDWHEIACEEEIKTHEQLLVPLPEKNADFHSLALALGRDLPRDHHPPSDRSLLGRWQKERRSLLRDTIRFREYGLRAEKAGERQKGGIEATFWRLRIGKEWTVPAVELSKGKGDRVAVLIADKGRKAAAGKADELLAGGHRVLAVDPFYLGESAMAHHAALYVLLMGGVGERALGVQAGQLVAVAKWVRSVGGAKEVQIVAQGPRTSTIALAAAAADPEAIAKTSLIGPLVSLKQVIEKNWSMQDCPEQFCFGLLGQFDIEDLAALGGQR